MTTSAQRPATARPLYSLATSRRIPILSWEDATLIFVDSPEQALGSLSAPFSVPPLKNQRSPAINAMASTTASRYGRMRRRGCAGG